MEDILGLMASNHRHCDDCFAAVEQAVAKNDWKGASAAFSRFPGSVCKHLDAEEAILFPAFENQTGMRMGPTQVMRSEHAQMRELLLLPVKRLWGNKMPKNTHGALKPC